MNIPKAVVWYYKLFGFRGVLTMCGYRFLGRPKEIRARAPGITHPIQIRIKTTDELTYRDVLLHEEYAFELPFSPKVIVDAGANIGTTSIYFAKKFPQARIIAVEAEASNFSVLVRNVRPYPEIIPVHAALWNRDGEINVAPPSDPKSGAFGEWGFVTHEGPGTKVRAITMETLMRELSLPVIDLVKVDIEGAEKEVFEDTGWLRGVGCLMIELHDPFRPGCTATVDRAMAEFIRSQRGQTTFYLRPKR